ncbi:MAG: cation diffusion facilitator family transporter [Chloroflexota bacterium]
MTHQHGHGHAAHADPHRHHDAGASNQRRLLVVLSLTSAYLLAEVVGGLLTGSLALLADAGHMLADIFGLSMSLAALRMAARPATPRRTFGFQRAEILAAGANAVLLLGIAAFILWEAWGRFREPSEIDSLPMLLVAVGGLVVNLIAFKTLHGAAGESLNLRGAFLEVIADLLGSAGAIVAALVIALTGWYQADPLVSVAIALFIVPRAVALLRTCLEVLLEATPAHLDLGTVVAAMTDVPGVAAVHDVHAWTIASGYVAMSAHVQANGRPSAEVLHDLQRLLREELHVDHVTLQVESADHADDGACCVMDPRCVLVTGKAP